jgi:hypothetical protein
MTETPTQISIPQLKEAAREAGRQIEAEYPGV